MQIGIACFVVFLVMAALMYSRKISALLALPIMAVAIALVGHIPPDRILSDVIAKGSVKLTNAYTTTIFGAILAELINRLGIAKSLVRWVAEFAGDSPFALGLLMTLVTALLFSSLGGLGAVIMVGTIILPVMLSLGILPITAGGLFLFGISLGGMFNLANWQLYMEVLHLPQAQIAAYVVPFSGTILVVILMFLLVELRTLSNVKWVAVGVLAIAVVFAVLGGAWLPAAGSMKINAAVQASVADPISITVAGVVLVCLIVYAIIRHRSRCTSLPGIAYLSPAIPLVLVLACHWDIIPAFLAGTTYAALSAWQRDSVNTVTRAIIEGTSTVAPAVVLMLGIGMLLAAVMDPQVSNAIAPMVADIVPTHPLAYIIVFTILAPLSLYRGPLSVWGMGSGIAALIQRSTTLGGSGIMSMLMSVGQLQGICDPTNTHNVWIATYLGTDTQALLRRTLPYAWCAVVAGLILAATLGYVR